MKLRRLSIETRIYLAAASMNIGGVLIFSRLFTNTAINAADPVVMSNFGLLMIVVWGLAYIGAAASIKSKWIAGAFAIEKSVYAVVWLDWMSKHSVANVYAEDAMAGIFFSIYGVNDILFMILFLILFFKRRAQE